MDDIAGRQEGPYGPIPRYTVAIGLPLEDRVVRYRSCTSRGPHSAAAAAVVWLHINEPTASIGFVEIEQVEERYDADLQDLVDYWDVA